MSKKQTILLSALDNYGGHPFSEVFDHVLPVYGANDIAAIAQMDDIQLALIIWGGADISPSIYGHRVSKYTGATQYPSSRDMLEIALAEKAIDLQIPIIGICRGAQLMCALSGGVLVQHVEKHAGGWHSIVTKYGEEYNCPSLHHQMMFPWAYEDRAAPEVELIAWTPHPRSETYVGQPDAEGNEKTIVLPGPEPEIAWFPTTKSLCIQSHPEFIQAVDHPFVAYCLRLTKQYILGETSGNESQTQQSS